MVSLTSTCRKRQWRWMISIGKMTLLLFWTTALLPSTLALATPQNTDHKSTRRKFALFFPSSSFFLASIISVGSFVPRPANAAPLLSPPLLDRFGSNILTAPPITAGTRYTGHDNLYFPDWLEGEWDVTQTLVSSKAPLGIAFIGGPMGSMEVAQITMSEQQKRLNEAVNLRLRFVRTNFGVVEDRVFNLRNRLNSFAGKSVVARVEYADVRESNRASVINSAGKDSDPLTTTLVYFKGPAAQKTFVISYGEQTLSQNGNKRWAGYEVERSIFALTNANTAPPVTTDTEVIYEFEQIGDGHVEGKLRLAGYLNSQSDKLYFDAKNRAVSLNDYNLSLRKVDSGSV